MGIPKNLRAAGMGIQRHTTLKKANGEHAQNTQEIMQLWTEWIAKNFQITPEQETPEIQHITENQWGQIQERKQKPNQTQQNKQKQQTPDITLPEDLKKIRTASPLYQILQENPEIKKMANI